MPGHGEKLSRKHEAAIAALLTTPNVTKAADAVGVSVNTLSAWTKRPDFAAAYKEARGRVLDEAILDLKAGSRRAVATVVQTLSSKQPALRLKAALGLLDRALRAHELMDLADRVAALEAVSEKKKG